MKNKAKVVAYYLPQFHPIPENDEWWGKGFTEWTNVAKAQPLYKSHYQPKIPADLGFYDLRLPQSRALQAEYAQKAGVTAFCYWHYWFGNGKKLLNLPFEEVVNSGKPDFPFCLAWANHSWYNKSWTSDKGNVSLTKSKLLVEQTYPGQQDIIDHFNYLLPAFKDKRYFKVHGKLLLVIYNPWSFNIFNQFKRIWNEMAKENNLPEFYFVAHAYEKYSEAVKFVDKGYDAVNLSLHHAPFLNDLKSKRISGFKLLKSWIHNHLSIKPAIIDYKDAILKMDCDLYKKDKVYPTIIPNWDHTPRSKNFGRVFQNCEPSLFYDHVKMILQRLKNKEEEDQIIFLKSWNEWGEGNYMEPDLKYGTGYIDSLKQVLSDID